MDWKLGVLFLLSGNMIGWCFLFLYTTITSTFDMTIIELFLLSIALFIGWDMYLSIEPEKANK